MRPALAVLAIAAATVACGGHSEPAANQTAATTAPQSTPTVPQATTKKVDAVAFEQLIALLPEAPGWTRGKPKGEHVNTEAAMSHATAEYQKGDASIDVEIIDSSFNELVLSPFTIFLAAGFSERSSEGFIKSAPVGGNPGFEKWNSDSRRAEVTVVIGNRFIVQAIGRNVDSVDPVRALVKAVDLKTLAALK
jgi:hypothetical protein